MMINISQNTKLVFIGTVDEIENSPLKNSLANWVVTFRVEKVSAGDFKGKTFSFRIHSPSMSGLEIGSRYTVEAWKTDRGFELDEHQWMTRRNQNS